MIKNYLSLFALLCAVSGAYLSFRRSFINELKEQMSSYCIRKEKKKESVTFFKLNPTYEFLAYFFLGLDRKKWLDLFNNLSDVTEKFKDDTMSFRIFVWFFFVFIFSFVSWSLG